MADQIPQDLVDEIRKSNDIVDIVGDYVALKKQGRNFFGLCPFHGENTPSFSVTQEKQIFHCFGCGKGGNVFTFLMEIEGFTFIQAIQHLAEKSGTVLPNQPQNRIQPQDSSEQASLSAYQWLTKLYHHLLRHTNEGKRAREYLAERGITDSMIEAFQIGYSPQSKDAVVQFLEKKGFHPQQMVSAGILVANDNNELTDRFRNRVVFPIRNHLGRTVGFGGRTLTEQEPKYLNSPESALFQKGKLLYNFDLARSEIRKKSQAVLFEGYMDVITAYQSGCYNGVATLGTSITEQQASLIKRYVESVVICYDGDKPGIEASYKAARLFQKIGCNVTVAILPEGLDPDAYIKKYGSNSFQHEVIEASHTYMSFLMEYYKKGYNIQNESERIQYISKIIDEIARLDRPMEREHYTRELAKAHDLSTSTILEEIHIKRKNLGNKLDKSNIKESRQIVRKKELYPAYHNAEKQLIAYMLYDSRIADKVRDELGALFNIDNHKIIVTHLYAYYEDGYEPDISHFIERIKDKTIKNEIIEIAMEPIHSEIEDKEIQDYIRIIKAEQGDKAVLRDLVAKQKRAEMNKDYVLAAQIGMEIMEIQRRLKNKANDKS